MNYTPNGDAANTPHCSYEIERCKIEMLQILSENHAAVRRSAVLME